jgi:hypothetical protein
MVTQVVSVAGVISKVSLQLVGDLIAGRQNVFVDLGGGNSSNPIFQLAHHRRVLLGLGDEPIDLSVRRLRALFE